MQVYFKGTNRKHLYFQNHKYKIKKFVGCFSEEQNAKMSAYLTFY